MKQVLFICTGNSIRSQMAEGLLRGVGTGRFKAFSAGTHPSFVDPLAVEVMSEIGVDVDISRQRSKSVKQYASQTFDCVITLCDHALDQCPAIDCRHQEHWPIDDPGWAAGTEEARMEAFRRAREEIRQRVEAFVAEHA